MVRRGLKAPAAYLSAQHSFPILVLVLVVCGLTSAQENPEVKTKHFPFITRVEAHGLFPVLEFANLFRAGGGAAFTLEYPLTPYFSPFVRAGTFYAPLNASGGLVLSEGTFGLSLGLRPTERLSLRLEGMGGLVSVASDGMSGTAYTAGARLGLGFRVHPALTISASGGLSTYFGSAEPFYLGASAGVFASLSLGEVRSDTSRVRIQSLKTEAVFPVFYSYYDDNPLGSLVIANGEDTRIEDVKVSFVVGQYMDRPKICVTIPSIAAGASVEAPLTALFNDGVLTLTEGSTVRGEVVVEYRQVGAKRSVSAPVEMRMHHRNAMNWLDDRRAAAFATPKDPASLWFSRYVSGIVRDRLRGDIDRNLQYAIGLFEAERLFGLSYVVDPASSYVEKSANEATVDYLQFPHQTLDYRGGDCDDLTILYTSLLQSVGIETAFITIPGHIYMAFVLDTPEERAKQDFYDPDLLIFREGRAWVPVEITMVKDGFVKAWRVGAKEWQDNAKTGSAALFPIASAWSIYPPVGVPDVNPNLNLPAESQIAQAFDLALDRYVARDIETKVATLVRTSEGKDIAEAANDLGILYARYGMLKEAWKAFSTASKAGYAPAWINLANVAFLRKDYKLAIEYYEYAGTLLPDEAIVLLGIARSRYEQENFTESDKAYARLKAVDPELASRYGYLASIFGGEGRAWSMSDRMASASWAGQKTARNEVQPLLIAEAVQVEEPFVPEPVAATLVEAVSVVASEAPAPTVEAQLVEAPVVAHTLTETESGIVQPLAKTSKPEPTPPVIADELPDDLEIASKKAAEAAALSQLAKAQSVDVAPVAPAREPAGAPVVVAPPVITEDLPDDLDLAAKRAAEAAILNQLAKTQAVAVAPVVVAPVDSVVEPVVVESAVVELEAVPVADAPVMVAQVAVEPTVEPEAAPVAIAPVVVAPVVVEQETVEPVSVAVVVPADEIPGVAVVSEPVVAEPIVVSVVEVPVVVEPVVADVEESALVSSPGPAVELVSEMVVADAESVKEQVPESVMVTLESEPEPENEVLSSPVVELALAEILPVEVKRSDTPAPVSVPAPASSPATVIPAVKEYVPNFVYESELPSERTIVVEGFNGMIPATGSWAMFGDAAVQLDPKQLYAKLSFPLTQGNSRISYSFKARSTGTEWVGFGIHVFARAVKTHKGYGEGESILVWFTSDPLHGSDGSTRIQVYRSISDSVMVNPFVETVISESLFDYHDFRIDVDPAKGSLAVSVDGSERYRLLKTPDFTAADSVTLRAMDKVEFSDFRVGVAR